MSSDLRGVWDTTAPDHTPQPRRRAPSVGGRCRHPECAWANIQPDPAHALAELLTALGLTPDPQQTRVCNTCQRQLPTSEFHMTTSRRRSRVCRTCQADARPA